MIAAFEAHAKNSPRITAAIVASSLSGLGDTIAQLTSIRTQNNRIDTLNKDMPLGTATQEPILFSYRRTLAMVSYSAFYGSCVMVPFFGYLNRKLGEKGVKAVIGKTIADTLCMTPTLGLPSFFCWTSLVQVIHL
jgi:hypothetical protein